jgi:hypothetical protein
MPLEVWALLEPYFLRPSHSKPDWHPLNKRFSQVEKNPVPLGQWFQIEKNAAFSVSFSGFRI